MSGCQSSYPQPPRRAEWWQQEKKSIKQLKVKHQSKAVAEIWGQSKGIRAGSVHLNAAQEGLMSRLSLREIPRWEQGSIQGLLVQSDLGR